MNKKSTIYFLLTAVLLIWGFIAYKIYAAMNEKGDIKINQYNVQVEGLYKQLDTFSLLLNYSDPFDKRNYTYNNEQIHSVSTKNSVSFNINKPSISSNPTNGTPISIKYFGLVKTDVKKTGMITINDKSVIIREGQTIENIRIIQFDKATLKYKNPTGNMEQIKTVN